ncbi:MAG TPA: hypothetical protein VMW50_00585 [Dehalococcoidia bacterium]|nr:hypothetical protein [Dehalococcoidia bacterium]
MAKTEVSAVQIQMAAAAGVKLLQVDDLPVPLSVAKSGALGILEGMLAALANGEVVLAAPQQENIMPGNVKPPMAPVQSPPASTGNEDGGKPNAEA